MNWYPGYRPQANFPPISKIKEYLSCPICNKGKRIDAKTKEERQCLACNGSGKLKRVK